MIGGTYETFEFSYSYTLDRNSFRKIVCFLLEEDSSVIDKKFPLE